MAYETKVILTAVADIVQTSSDLGEAYKRIARLANAEGVILPPLDDVTNKSQEKVGGDKK
ncbi:MAG: hypothetical protein FWB91_02330 [Defluviitaleaceae bacterium]|nr:hypothetical protein [Defluviitaleaceae bacterium]